MYKSDAAESKKSIFLLLSHIFFEKFPFEQFCCSHYITSNGLELRKDFVR